MDDVIFGCVCQNGAQAGNIGRSVVLSSKLPQSVPGVSVDRQCGSSQQSIHFAAQAVMSGVQDVVIAGGVEVMSLVPIGSNIMDGKDKDRGFPNGSSTQPNPSSTHMHWQARRLTRSTEPSSSAGECQCSPSLRA